MRLQINNKTITYHNLYHSNRREGISVAKVELELVGQGTDGLRVLGIHKDHMEALLSPNAAKRLLRATDREQKHQVILLFPKSEKRSLRQDHKRKTFFF
jgi:hypothetical protein